MCPEPSNVSGNGGASASGQPEISQEERQKQIQRFNELTVEQQNAALRYALSGSETPAKSFNPTPDGAGIFGFGTSSPTVDQQKLNEITNQMFDFTMKASSMPFGIGARNIENSIGQFFQAIMNCFKFEPLQMPPLGGSTQASGGAQAGGGTQAGDGAQAGGGTQGTPAAQTTPTQPTAPAVETPASSDASKYSKYGNGNLYKLDGDSGNRYVLRDGEYVKVDRWSANGEHVIGGIRYDNDGKVITKPTVKSNTVKNSASLASNMDKGIDTLASQQFNKSQLTALIDSNPNKYQLASTQTDANGIITMVVKIKSDNTPTMSSGAFSHEYTLTFDKSGNPTSIKGANADSYKKFNIKYNNEGIRTEMIQEPTTASYTTNYGQRWTYNSDGSQSSYEKYHMKAGFASTSKVVDESSKTNKYGKGQSQPKGKIPAFSSETAGYTNVNGSIKITQGNHVWTKSGDKFVRTNSKTGEVTTFDKNGNRIEYYNPTNGYKTSYTAKGYTVRYNKDWKK